MLGIEARPLPCDPNAGFVPDPDEAGRLIDARTRAIVLVTPNNPTGAIYPEHVIGAFADLCRRRGLWLVLDETYRDFLPPSHGRAHGLFADGAWRERVIGLYSFSKAYCIPGYRLGAVTADAAAIGELAKILDCIQICPPRAGQRALAWGIDALRRMARGQPARDASPRRRPSAARSGRARNGRWIRSAPISPMSATHSRAKPPRRWRKSSRSSAACWRCPAAISAPGQDTHLRMAFGNIDVAGIEELGERLRGFAL